MNSENSQTWNRPRAPRNFWHIEREAACLGLWLHNSTGKKTLWIESPQNSFLVRMLEYWDSILLCSSPNSQGWVFFFLLKHSCRKKGSEHKDVKINYVYLSYDSKVWMRSKPQVLCVQVLLSRLWCCLVLGDPLKAGPYGEEHRPCVCEGYQMGIGPTTSLLSAFTFPNNKVSSEILIYHKPLNNRVKKPPLSEST